MFDETQILTAIDSGIQTVIPSAVLASPQTVYLDFDGASASYFNRDLDIAIENINVEDSGFGDEDIRYIVETLNEQFDDVIFTFEVPQMDQEYSTIYIGRTDDFDLYGEFLGLAETIDSGNKIHDDNAFVFLDSTASLDTVTSVIAHETRHIVSGLQHDGEGLAQYAISQRYTVSNGVVSSGLTLENGDSMSVFSGGRANATTVNSSGNMEVNSGGTATSTTINSSGLLFVYCNGTADSTTVNSVGRMYVFRDGTASSTTVNSGGILYVFSGCTATDIKAENGAVFELTVAPDTYIQGTYAGSAFEMKNANVTGYTVNSWRDLDVSSGGTAARTTINSRGYLYVSSGGMANATTVNSSGNMLMYSGATATSTTVNSSGSLHVSSGGTADRTIVNRMGFMDVSSGATANNITVNYGGFCMSSAVPRQLPSRLKTEQGLG